MKRFRLPVGIAVVAALLATTLGIPASTAAGHSSSAAAAVGYPFPLPDFSHPDRPHAPLFKKRQAPIPTLVVYGRFDDLTNLSEAGTRDKFFPIFSFGTVADYYLSTGLGVLTPVVETYGERDNGIVMVELGQSAPWYGQDAGVRRRKMLDLADAYVDFARYDTNNNGRVEDAELAVVTLVTSPNPKYSCGQTTGVAGGRTLDGKTVAFRTADGGSLTNSLTFAHEIGHQSFELFDHYGFGVGAWDLAGPTCTGATETWQEPNAFHKLHLGGIQPTVITKDRYVTLLPDTVAPYQSYLLYDPERGTDDYFMLEAREPKAGTYDQNVPDKGLVVWRVDERNVVPKSENVRGVELVRPDGVRTMGCIDEDVDGKVDEDPVNGRDDDGDGKIDEDHGPDQDGDGKVDEDPVNGADDDGDGKVDEDPEAEDGDCYGGRDTDAWDPADPRTRQREMTAPWADGTGAKVALRAIGQNFADQRQTYVDVRGPGILVDAADAQGLQPRPGLVAGGTADFSFAVMNTGEATDTFDFTVLVPAGWTATTQRMTLAAGQRATATIKLTVGTDEAANGLRTLYARGKSITDSSVVTDQGFLADTFRPASVTYTGDRTVDQSDKVKFSAVVKDGLNGAPLPGRRVRFFYDDRSFVSAVSGDDGVASISWVPSLPPGEYPLRLSVSGQDGYTSATGMAPFTVEPENATIAITSPTLYADNAIPPMTIKVTEEADENPADLSQAGVKVQLRSAVSGEVRTYTGTAGTDGVATLPIDAPAGVWTATVELTGDYFTGPPIEAELVVYDPDGEATGAAVGPDTTGTTAVLTVSSRYFRGSPTGAVTLVAGTRVFTGTTVRWLAVAGKSAVLEVTGRLDNRPATLRATLLDNGNGIGVHDRFSVKVTSATETYTTGVVTTKAGNFIIRTR